MHGHFQFAVYDDGGRSYLCPALNISMEAIEMETDRPLEEALHIKWIVARGKHYDMMCMDHITRLVFIVNTNNSQQTNEPIIKMKRFFLSPAPYQICKAFVVQFYVKRIQWKVIV